MRESPLALPLLVVLMSLWPVSAVRGEPLTPERLVDEIRWKDFYTDQEARTLVLSVANMYQDEIDRAIREAIRPLRAELESLEEINRQLIAGLPAGATGGRDAEDAGGAATPRVSDAERRLRIWRVVGITAAALGVVEAALLLGR